MRLQDICEINPRIPRIDDDTEVSFVPMTSVSEDGEIDTSDIRPYIDVKKGYTSFKEDDVLFAKITPCMENGKGAIARGLKNGYGCGSSEFHVLRTKGQVMPEWIYYLTSWSYFRREAEKHMTGSAGQRRVPKLYLENYEIRLPELSDQEYQVQTLTHIKEVIDYRKAELVAFEELTKARFVELTESVNTVATRMGDIATYINGYAFKPTDWTESGLPIIRIQNLNDVNAKYNYFDGKIDSKYLVTTGDVLVSWATHLEAYIWDGDSAWLNQHIFKALFDKMPINKLYFVYATEDALRQAFKNAHGFKPTMEHIKRRDFENAIVKLPDMEIQNQFADFVVRTGKSKAAVQKSLDETQVLFDSLMQKYFG